MYGYSSNKSISLSQSIIKLVINFLVKSGCFGVMVITIAQLHLKKPKLRFCAGSNPTSGVSEICDGEDPC